MFDAEEEEARRAPADGGPYGGQSSAVRAAAAAGPPGWPGTFIRAAAAASAAHDARVASEASSSLSRALPLADQTPRATSSIPPRGV
eukprot:3432982-Heterocapsa_arctica.AAC.1